MQGWSLLPRDQTVPASANLTVPRHAACPRTRKLPSLRVASHVFAHSFALLANALALALRLPGGFGRDVAQQRGEADVPCPRLGLEFLANLVVRRGHQRDPCGYVGVLLECNLS